MLYLKGKGTYAFLLMLRTKKGSRVLICLIRELTDFIYFNNCYVVNITNLKKMWGGENFGQRPLWP